MGQRLPLPDRIPFPEAKVRKEMEDTGIILDYDPDIHYVLPTKWRIINGTMVKGYPIFYIVDDKDVIS